ncbi:MAG: hypothetical protein AVDCRST_MAG42-3095 [uncultured Chthoniobacterales bacterium]|uniref:Uncharacterized protein n=1 Tax=uncultured Chthoniobacterales bacterium TaxID=1836801 RepID=A0A6J4J521_9BACT|nr:MAG: hypothetical protein AVDCRST_MAG42-3095 [uncultured Chthoniobacterales bacterium]
MKPNLLRLALAATLICGAIALTSVAQPPPPGGAEPQTPTAGLAGDVVDFKLLLPLLPEAPAGWKADAPEGSTEDLGEMKLTNVHRDYQKDQTGDAPTTAISILDSAANPEYVESTTSAWDADTSDLEGYSKKLNIEGMPGFETFENDGKHGSLWLLVAKRYFLQIETSGQDPKELQEWLKRIDVKKLAAIK